MKRWKRLFAADTLALILFGLVSGVFVFLYEVHLVDLTMTQWLYLRILYNGIKFAGARLCGKLTDKIRAKVNGDSKHWFRKVIADTTALFVYQMPIYLISALIVGASTNQILVMATAATVDNLLFNWMYGFILDWVRKKFNKV